MELCIYVLITYFLVVVLLLVASIFSVKKGWPGFFKRLFITLFVCSILAYPLAMHKYATDCYVKVKYGSCNT